MNRTIPEIGANDGNRISIMGAKSINIAYIVLKILMWILILLFAGDFIMQTISYSLYKGDRELKETTFVPQEIQISDNLSGYGYNLSKRLRLSDLVFWRLNVYRVQYGRHVCGVL